MEIPASFEELDDPLLGGGNPSGLGVFSYPPVLPRMVGGQGQKSSAQEDLGRNKKEHTGRTEATVGTHCDGLQQGGERDEMGICPNRHAH